MVDNPCIVEAKETRELLSVTADAIVILKNHEPYYDELRKEGLCIQKEFGIKDENVKLFESYEDALIEFFKIEKKFNFKKTHFSEFVPGDFFCAEVDMLFRKHAFCKSEVNLALITFLVGVLRSMRK